MIKRILITGVPHSGTSCVAGLFHAAGLEFGCTEKELDAAHPGSFNHFEHQGFAHIIRNIPGFKWTDPTTWGYVKQSEAAYIKFLDNWEKRYVGVNTVWKDNRGMILARMLRRRCSNLRVVGVFRPLEKILGSHALHNKRSHEATKQFALPMIDLLRDVSDVKVFFDDVLGEDGYSYMVEKFHILGLPTPDPGIMRTVRKELVHA